MTPPTVLDKAQHLKLSVSEILMKRILIADISIWGLQYCVIPQLKCLCDKSFNMSCFNCKSQEQDLNFFVQ